MRIIRMPTFALSAILAALVLFAVPARAVTIDRVVSPGGIEAWLVQDHSMPIITLELSLPRRCRDRP